MSTVLDACLNAAEKLKQMVIDAVDGAEIDEAELARSLVMAGVDANEFHEKVELLQERREAADRLESAKRHDAPLAEAKRSLQDATAEIDEAVKEHNARLVVLRRRAEEASLEVERIRREKDQETREAKEFLLSTADPEIDRQKRSDEVAYSNAMTRYNAPGATALRERLERLKRLELAAANRTSITARDEATELKRELSQPKWQAEADAMAAAEYEMQQATLRGRNRSQEKMAPESMGFFG